MFEKITVEKTKDFFISSTHIFRNKDVSCKLRGLFGTIMSLPPDWDFSISGLVAILPEGQASVYRMINELISLGYCEKISVRDEKGKFTETEYRFYEIPKELNLSSEVNPVLENPYMENRPQYNIQQSNNTSNEVLNTTKKDSPKPPNVPKVTRKRRIYLEQGWRPPQSEIERLSSQLTFVNIEDEIIRFVEYYSTSTSKSTDWMAKFLDWVSNRQKWNKEKAGRGNLHPIVKKQNGDNTVGTLDQELSALGLKMAV